jgi:hypothetical protein
MPIFPVSSVQKIRKRSTQERLEIDENLPIRRHNKHIPIHSQVFSIPTAYIQPDGAGLEILQEAFDNGPGLFEREEEERDQLFGLVLFVFCIFGIEGESTMMGRKLDRREFCDSEIFLFILSLRKCDWRGCFR